MKSVPQPPQAIKSCAGGPLVPLTDTPLYVAGFTAYCQGALLTDQPTLGQRRGWLGALRAEAEAKTPGYADRVGI